MAALFTAEATPVPADVNLESLKKYREVTREMGIDTRDIKKREVAIALNKAGVRTYDEATVTTFLTGLYGRHWLTRKPTWGWRALRQIDREIVRSEFPSRNGMLLVSSTYGLPVPLPVLYTVQRLDLDLKPFRPRFFVSDARRDADDQPRAMDPFLLLICGVGEESSWFRGVIERWDEPAFRE